MVLVEFCVLVIGKGGEQIAQIQSESDCRVQFAPGKLPSTSTGIVSGII